MPHNALLELIPKLNNQRQLCVVGAAVVDIVVDTPKLPERGGDTEVTEKGIHVGGCALNIAITLKRLGIDSLNALPLGKGNWATLIESAMAEKGVNSVLRNDNGDNGWCMALVEPDGERTFVSVSGVENQWTRSLFASLTLADDALVYVSGYQLASESGEVLISWLESLPTTVDIFVDFGPRIVEIPPKLFSRLLALKPIVSLNRQEAEVLGMTSADMFTTSWFDKYQCPLILRIDSDGALFTDSHMTGCVSPFKANVVDTIGAGDSHAGGVLAGLVSGWELPDAVLLGNAVASFVVSHRGGDCAPSQTEIADYLLRY
ncbi:kinase [Photobacterium profundum]|uniref:Putative kinase n=1 Tax=Photobacterium profundum 3TCK TaxID=314280 RepID=Q1Z5V9_9GAMM|nr:PfkB family carbohydrate kinase [Photobacterium profundum]EAS43773.1 putative kinase [Photobacterium profundum 3TCK]PSV64520.1 kinase [Photobacterium profundum]